MPTAGFFVKDIVIIGDRFGRNGEHRESMGLLPSGLNVVTDHNLADHTRANRIVKQIILIAMRAKSEADPEQLTRAITDEFSFYTRYTPLSIEEYRFIINQLAIDLKSFPPNIVIIASSMPVLWPDGAVRNAVLHIQTPNDSHSRVKIHHFSKKHHAYKDPYYRRSNTNHELYPRKADDEQSPQYSPHVVLANTALCINDVNQYHSAILVAGARIPPILHAIDICLDHTKGVAIRNATALLSALASPPLYISHIISAQSTASIPQQSVAEASHADHLWVNPHGITKETAMYTVFGTQSVAVIYQSKRAELLHSRLFDIATRRRSRREIAELKDPYHNTLLHLILLQDRKTSPACVHFGKRIKKLLPFFKNSDINQQNDDGDTPLHLALRHITDLNMLIRFLEQGARLDIKNREGITPIKLASQLVDPRVYHGLITKLINHGRVYLAHRDTILAFIDEIEPPWQEKVMMATFQFELSDPNPQPAVLLALLKKLAPLSVLNLSITHLLTQEHEPLLEQLLSSDPTYASFNASEKKIILIYLSQKPYQLFPFKRELQPDSPFTKKLETLLTAERFAHYRSWVTHTLAQEEKANLLLQNGVTDPLSLLDITAQLSDFNVYCAFSHGLTLAEYFLAQLYRFSQSDPPIEFELMKQILNQIGTGLYYPSPRLHVENIVRSGLIEHSDHPIRWLYTTLIKHELSSEYPQFFFISSIPDAMIAWHEPASRIDTLTLAESMVFSILRSTLPLSEFKNILDRLLPNETRTLFEMITHIVQIKECHALELYQQILVYQSRQGRFANVPLIIELLSKEINLSVEIDAQLTLAEQLFAQVYILKTLHILREKEMHIILNYIIPQLKVPIKMSIKNIAASLTEQHSVQEGNIKREIYQLLLNYSLNQMIPAAHHFYLMLLTVGKVIDLKSQRNLSNHLTLAEQAIATFYKAQCLGYPIDHEPKYQILRMLFSQLETPIEQAVGRIVQSFFIFPNQSPEVINRGVEKWIYQTLFIIELMDYTPRQHALKYLPIAMQQREDSSTRLNAAEEAISLASFLEDEKLFHQAYRELIKARQLINLYKISATFPQETQQKRADWMRQALFRTATGKRITLEFLKKDEASLDELLDAIRFLPLREDCGLANGLTFAEQLIAQAVIVFIQSKTIGRSPADIETAEHLLAVAACSLTKPVERSVLNIVASFLIEPNSKFSASPIEIEQSIYRILIKKECENAIANRLVQVDLLLDVLPHVEQLHDIPGLEGDLTMAEQIVKVATLLKNPDLLAHVMAHYSQTNQYIDTTKVLEQFSDDSPEVHWLPYTIQDLDSRQTLSKQFKRGNHANITLIYDFLGDVDLNAASGLNNGLTIREQVVVQAYLSNRSDILSDALDDVPPNTAEAMMEKIAKALFDPHLDFNENKRREHQFKTFFCEHFLHKNSQPRLTTPPLAAAQVQAPSPPTFFKPPEPDHPQDVQVQPKKS